MSGLPRKKCTPKHPCIAASVPCMKRALKGRICLLRSHHLHRRSGGAFVYFRRTISVAFVPSVAFAYFRRTISIDDRVGQFKPSYRPTSEIRRQSLHVQHQGFASRTSVARACIEVPHGHLELLHRISLHMPTSGAVSLFTYQRASH